MNVGCPFIMNKRGMFMRNQLFIMERYMNVYALNKGRLFIGLKVKELKRTKLGLFREMFMWLERCMHARHIYDHYERHCEYILLTLPIV